MGVESYEEEQSMENMESCSSLSSSVSGDAEVAVGRKWEKLLPAGMFLRILLVEADDSTRRIITAHLRKCSYKVAAVPDGLKAWEILKERPHDIDLILTEAELPSISGYALLTLIMEHETLKNIPVIMMSSCDSISMVLQSMLKGAADFLIKPVRRNELQNLWQHVWRKQTQTAVHVPQDTEAAQHKIEATTDNIDSSTQENKEENGSDTRGLSQVKCGSESDLSNSGRHKECAKLVKKSPTPRSETRGKSFGSGPEVVSCNEAYNSNASRLVEDRHCVKTMTMDAGECSHNHRENDDIHADELVVHSSAIDLIGKFENRPRDIDECFNANDGTKNFAPYLELSLKRFHPSCSKDFGIDEQHMLNHSHASAFSWGDISKTLKPLSPAVGSNFAGPKEGASTYSQLNNQLPENSFGASLWHGVVSTNRHENMVSHFGQTDVTFPGSQFGCIPFAEATCDSSGAGYGHLFPPVTQSGFPPARSPISDGQWEQSPFLMTSSLHSKSEVLDSEQGCPSTNHSAEQTMQEEENNLGSTEGLRHDSLVPGLSANSSLCSGVPNSRVCGSICSTVDSDATLFAAAAKTSASESLNNNHLLVHDGRVGMDSKCSTLREAALVKFRLKRKDRCYDKKVRYQSRKRLAEQRPRVKGQFVRQVQTGGSADADDFP